MVINAISRKASYEKWSRLRIVDGWKRVSLRNELKLHDKYYNAKRRLGKGILRQCTKCTSDFASAFSSLLYFGRSIYCLTHESFRSHVDVLRKLKGDDVTNATLPNLPIYMVFLRLMNLWKSFVS